MAEVYVNRDGEAVHNGKKVQFPATLAGAMVTVDDDGTVPEPAPEEETQPNRSSSKADWVDYAVEEHGADRDTAESMTKQDLIDAYTVGSEV